FHYSGHTSYLTEKSGKSESLMILADEGLRIALATEHIPIQQVAENLTQQKIEKKLSLLHESLIQDFGIGKPTIAVLGLNPHAGDNNLIGKEESEIIIPAVQSAQEKGILAVGPFSADGFFGSGYYQKFDAVLAMYHDQGLIPFKTLSFTRGVNFTAGLPIIRTSPDHGTAFEIAGKGIAHADSLQAAIFLAIDIHSNRNIYRESHSNPIKRNLLEAE
ncbi:MAG: PdxA family protein, partial [Chitinophagales bacterium]